MILTVHDTDRLSLFECRWSRQAQPRRDRVSESIRTIGNQSGGLSGRQSAGLGRPRPDWIECKQNHWGEFHSTQLTLIRKATRVLFPLIYQPFPCIPLIITPSLRPCAHCPSPQRLSPCRLVSRRDLRDLPISPPPSRPTSTAAAAAACAPCVGASAHGYWSDRGLSTGQQCLVCAGP